MTRGARGLVLAWSRRWLRRLSVRVAWVAALVLAGMVFATVCLVAFLAVGPAPVGETSLRWQLAVTAAVGATWGRAADLIPSPWPFVWYGTLILGALFVVLAVVRERVEAWLELTLVGSQPGFWLVAGRGRFSEMAAARLSARHPTMHLQRVSDLRQSLGTTANLSHRLLENALRRCARLYLLDAAPEANLGAVHSLLREQVGRMPLLESVQVRVDDRSVRREIGKRASSPAAPGTTAEVQFVSVIAMMLRETLRSCPLQRLVYLDRPTERIVAILGLGREGLEALAQSVRMAASYDARITVLLIDRTPSESLAYVEHLYPGLRSQVELRPITFDPALPEGAAILLDRVLAAAGAPTAWFIAVAEPRLARRWASGLASACRSSRIHLPLLYSVAEPEPEAEAANTLAYQHWPESTLAEDDRCARSVHESYLREAEAQGRQEGSAPALMPWDELWFDFREENRSHADHWWAKAVDLGCRVRAAPRAETVALSNDAVEREGRSEHLRWNLSRVISGWRYGPERDDSTRIHPCITVWEKLPAAMQSYDFRMIRELSGSLARCGYSLWPLRHRWIATGDLPMALREVADSAAALGPGELPAVLAEVDSAESLRFARELARTSGVAVSLLLLKPLPNLVEIDSQEGAELAQWALWKTFRIFLADSEGDSESRRREVLQMLEPGVETRR